MCYVGIHDIVLVPYPQPYLALTLHMLQAAEVAADNCTKRLLRNAYARIKVVCLIFCAHPLTRVTCYMLLSYIS